MTRPIPFSWDGEAMVPLKGFGAACDRAYVIGQVYRLAPAEERSAKSHSHFFAAVHDAWANLPEKIAPRFPTSEHLRKFALVKAGYCDVHEIIAADDRQAMEAATLFRQIDGYAVITINGPVVTVHRAQSQSRQAMRGKAFQESKTAVLDIISEMIGVDAGTLHKQAGQAA